MFLVFSDDQPWCKQNLGKFTSPAVIFNLSSQGVAESLARLYPDLEPADREAVFELMVRASCDHSILTGGTYSWWGGWLGHGLTVTDRTWPRPGSNLDKIVNKADYYPPAWLDM